MKNSAESPPREWHIKILSLFAMQAVAKGLSADHVAALKVSRPSPSMTLRPVTGPTPARGIDAALDTKGGTN